MAIELKVPEIGESITEVEIGDWLKTQGQRVEKDEPIVTLESEKATVEMPAPEAGTLAQILKKKGDVAKVGEVIARLETDGQTAAPKGKQTKQSADAGSKAAQAGPPPSQPALEPQPEHGSAGPTKASQAASLGAAERSTQKPERRPAADGGSSGIQSAAPAPEGTAAPREAGSARDPVRAEMPAPSSAPEAEAAAPLHSSAPPKATAPAGRAEEVVPMSRLRRTVAERLVEAQRNAALLTTFNEADMSSVLALREQYGEVFKEKYNVKLGFMSFFVKACIDGLKQFPVLNAEVRGTNIVYRNYYDIGVAIGSGRGLVVPVLRNAELLSFAEVEIAIGDFARRAKDNKLKVDELQGGTFTLSNGGVYGSLLSTPIVNPPQSGVLGLHAIQQRPVARDGNVVIKPMMYLALTYDHRVVDGREAVSFLKRIKEAVESPSRMLLEV